MLELDVEEGWVGEAGCAGEGELELEVPAEDDGAVLDEVDAAVVVLELLVLSPPLVLLSPPTAGPGGTKRARGAIWCGSETPRRS